MHHIGHNGRKKVYYFSKDNRLVEIPYDFTGIIIALDKGEIMKSISHSHEKWMIELYKKTK